VTDHLPTLGMLVFCFAVCSKIKNSEIQVGPYCRLVAALLLAICGVWDWEQGFHRWAAVCAVLVVDQFISLGRAA